MTRLPIRLRGSSLAVTFFVCAAAGCGGAVAEDTAGFGAESATSAQPIAVPNPDAPYFVNVTANGTGCPAGTWDVDIDDRGETFTLTFSAYEAAVNPGQLLDVKDCQLGIDLHSPQGLSYSVAEFFYTGFAFLDRGGMRARQTARYYFQGNPLSSADGRTEIWGPYDDDYTYRDRIGITDLVWSPCGTDRLLNIQTRILVQNDRYRRGTGYVNTLAADGSIVLVFRLAWRYCS